MDKQTSPVPERVVTYMSFYDALRELQAGKRITKAEWNDTAIYCLLQDSRVRIYINDKFSDWIISEADMVGDDWIVL